MTPPRQGAAVVAAGLLLVVAAIHGGPVVTPPLYDGLCIGAPYRYLSPPPNQPAAPPAAGAQKTDPVDVSAGSVSTDESPPQAQVLFSGGTFVTPPGAATLELSLTPVKPPATPPSGGRIDGNVYRLAVTSEGVAAPPRTDHPITIVLRSPTVTTDESLQLFADGHWTPLQTSSISCAFQWTANVTRLGDLALVNPAGGGARPGQPAPAQAAAASRLPLLAVTLAGLLVLAVATILMARLGRRRSARNPRRPGDGRG